MEENPGKSRSDHDLLIEIATEMRRAVSDIKDLGKSFIEMGKQIEGLNASVDGKIAAAVAPKLDRKEFMPALGDSQKQRDDHEKRLRFIERWVWGAVGILGFIQLLIASGVIK